MLCGHKQSSTSLHYPFARLTTNSLSLLEIRCSFSRRCSSSSLSLYAKISLFSAKGHPVFCDARSVVYKRSHESFWHCLSAISHLLRRSFVETILLMAELFER